MVGTLMSSRRSSSIWLDWKGWRCWASRVHVADLRATPAKRFRTCVDQRLIPFLVDTLALDKDNFTAKSVRQ